MANRWVCLMYHDIGNSYDGRRDYFSVSERGFARQLEIIRAEGLRGCSLHDALARREARVAISFDDGAASAYHRAFPVLVEHGMTATFFITTSWVGTPGYVTWDQLREMKAAGMSIQSHTRTHPFLSELDVGRLADELRGSKAVLDEQLGQSTDQIALPGGDAPRARCFGMLEEAGYRVVGTSRWGVNRDTDRAAYPLRVRRCTVRGELTSDAFRAVLGGDRWLSLKRRCRERVLASVRSSMGPTRYARWRRRALHVIDRALGGGDGDG